MPPPTNTILQTKLRCPPLASGLLNRPRLLARLDGGAGCTLTLVAAAAGSGKTSLVRQWIERQTTAVAWLQLDANDSDPTLFFTYMVHALRRIAPQFGIETEMLLHGSPLPPLPVIVQTLSNEIDQLGQTAPCLLVLDDYHLVQNAEIESACAELVLRPPAGFRLLVISRQAPGWPLSRLRLENRLLLLNTDDLRFTADETSAYLQLNDVSVVDAEMMARLQKQTEGWAAGLQLALLALRQTDDAQALLGPQGGLAGFVGSDNRYLLEYMVDEVLGKLSGDLLAFMAVTSICARFTPSLCQVLTGLDREQVQSYLQVLEEAHLFLIPLGSSAAPGPSKEGGRHTWYRYHHLMEQTLGSWRQEAMSAAEVTEMHRRAAAWLGERGYIEEALEHCVAGEHWEAAAQLACGQLNALLDREDRRTIDRWLHRFPAAEVAARPGLLLMQAWSCFFNLDMAGVAQALARSRQVAAARVGDDGQGKEQTAFGGQDLVLQGHIDYIAGDMDAVITTMQEAIPLLANGSAFVYTSAYFHLGSAMQFAGRGEEAEKLLLQTYHGQSKPSQASARLLFAISVVRFHAGRLGAACESAEMLLQESQAARLALLEGWAHDLLGRIEYERNHLVAAEMHFAALREHCYAAHRGCADDGFTGSLLIAAAQGSRETVDRISSEWRSFAQSLWGLPSPLHASARARAALLMGDLHTAQRWAAAFSAPLTPAPMLWLEASHITKLRCLLAAGGASNLAAANSLAAECLAHTERLRNVPVRITLLGLHSLVLDGLGQRKAAVSCLRRALHLGATDGFVRAFVELGPGMLNLLGAVNDLELADYVANLRAAFTPTTPRPPAQIYDSPAAALTQRELEVLALLATPMSIQEIADKLVISYSTVRQHTAHIYEKLGVGKRRHAVLAAAELGLLA